MPQADPEVHENEWRPSRNLPPLNRMDLVGIAVAVLGSAALILIAVISLDHDRTNPYSAVTIARVLLATGALLVNMAKDLAARGEILITKSRADEELVY